MDVYENLKANNIELTEPLSAVALYKPVNQTGNLLFISGQGSIENGVMLIGKAGKDVSLEDAQHAAKVSAVNTLSLLQSYLKDLNRVKARRQDTRLRRLCRRFH